MALGDPYATRDELKARLDIPDADTLDDNRMDEALTTVSREIETWCGRQFNNTTVASARVYQPRTTGLLVVDDFHTTTDLTIAVDNGDDGTYETTWPATDYALEPRNGIVSGQTGWPYWRIVATGNRWWPTTHRRPSVQVTAQWGWAAVPAPVKEACLIAAAELFKLGDAPFGIAGYGEFGPVRIRLNSRAMSLLAPYRLNPVKVG
ncbi:MAG TPA: hypothetical protein VF174_07345 [Micromonosporaceae bacterium]